MGRPYLLQLWRFTATSIASLPFLVIAESAFAQTNQSVDPSQWRWFDVEVLVFKHLNTDVEEQFPWLPPRPVQNAKNDLLTTYYAPNFGSFLYETDPCDYDNALMKGEAIWLCHQPNELDLSYNSTHQTPLARLNRFNAAPVNIVDGFGGEMEESPRPFLLPSTAMELTELRENLVRRNIGEPLLHQVVRQPVFNRSDSYTFRIFGGTNFGNRFAQDGYLRPQSEPEQQASDWSATGSQPVPRVSPQEDLFAELEELLQMADQGDLQLTLRAQQTPPPPPADRADVIEKQPLWELEGLIHIYLVANYLHIESDLQLREPETVRFSAGSLADQAQLAIDGQEQTQPFLRRYDLQQLRRVISHETHYFDHPKFGIVVQIRRTDLSARR
ncbi:MAG TPA: CsiV family protein [Pseudidiomarina sp.]|nr:CsiV family protein [Pseudidiomarina sp.]